MSTYIIEELSCESKHHNKNREYSEKDKDYINSKYNKIIFSSSDKVIINYKKKITLDKFNALYKEIEDCKSILGVNIKYPWYYCNKCNGHTP